MAKRKYARFRDQVGEYSECANQKCKWIGKDEEKITIPKKNIEFSFMLVLACPKCKKDVFRALVKEYKPENF